MNFCPTCNFTSNEPMNFCPKCGSKMEQYVPAPQPVYTQPSPVYTAAPPSKAKSIVGMALSIAGLAMCSLSWFYSLIALMAEDLETAGSLGFVFFFFSFPLSLVGLILSKNYINAGGSNTFSRVGKILGIIGVVITSVTAFFGLIMLGSS